MDLRVDGMRASSIIPVDDGCECVRVLFEITVHTSKIRGICFFRLAFALALAFVVWQLLL